MDKEEIIKLAREAGLVRTGNKWVEPARWGVTEIERFAALVAAEKEKQIIDILERLQQRNDSHNYYGYAIKVIRGEI